MEITHYFDSSKNILIYSTSRSFYVIENGAKFKVKLPLSLLKYFLSSFRLLRRLFRLDKSYCHPVFDKNGKLRAVIIIYQSNVYLWNFDKLVKTLSLSGCRNIMHQAMAECENGYLYFGEYGPNKGRNSVPIYRSIDQGLTWQEIYRFLPGEIKHVHSIQWDIYEKKLWICTGDQDGECKIILADPNFNHLEVLGDGSQKWRTCHIIFEKNYVVWGMDSQLTDCYMIKLNRENRSLEFLSKVSGPVWYGRRWSKGRYLVTTSVEPGINCLDRKSKVYVSSDLHNWTVLWSFDKDYYNSVYFKFGSIYFSNGNNGEDSFYMCFEAIKGLDGKSILVNKDSNFDS
jgi:hypothetical protein